MSFSHYELDKHCRCPLTVYLREYNWANIVSIVQLFIAHVSPTILGHMPAGSQTLPIPLCNSFLCRTKRIPPGNRWSSIVDCTTYIFTCVTLFSSCDLRAGGNGSHPCCDTKAVSDAMEKCLLTFSLFISPALLPTTHPRQVNTPPAHTTFFHSLVLFSVYSLWCSWLRKSGWTRHLSAERRAPARVMCASLT